MDPELAGAIERFVEACPYVVAIYDLLAKVRIALQKGYFLDLYYNATLGKYAYTLVRFDRRVIGWDNAPHHSGLANFPHHFHRENGSIVSSDLIGKPDQDIDHIITAVNEILSR